MARTILTGGEGLGELHRRVGPGRSNAAEPIEQDCTLGFSELFNFSPSVRFSTVASGLICHHLQSSKVHPSLTGPPTKHRVREAKSPRDPRMWSSKSLLLGLAAAILVEFAGSARTLVVRLWHDDSPPYFF